MGGPDQEVEGLVGLVDQEDLMVDVGEFVQLGKVVVALRALLAQGICLHLEWHQENGLALCYSVGMLLVSFLLEARLYLPLTSGQTAWFSLTAFQTDSKIVYYME